MPSKSPPNDFNAERAIITCLMKKNSLLEDARRILGASDFFNERHQIVIETIYRMSDEGKPFDIISLKSRLQSDGNLEKIGGIMVLSEMLEETSMATNIIHYAEVIAEKSRLRTIIRNSEIAINQSYSDGADSKEILQQMESDLAALTDSVAIGYTKPIEEFARDAYEQVKETFEKGFRGLQTGFNDLDRMTGGLHPGNMVLIAGRPSMGKTSFAMDIAERIAQSDKEVLIFSVEMEGKQLALRMLSGASGINGQNLMRGDINEHEWNNLIESLEKVSGMPMTINDNSSIKLFEIRSEAKKMKQKGKLSLIVIDYIQLMNTDKSENRQNEVAELSRGIKRLARDLGVPVIALSQLSRAVEQRSGKKRPILADLRESGSMEQDADLVLLLYRPEAYGEMQVSIHDVNHPSDGMTEIIVAKQRNGPTGSFWLKFNKETTHFMNFETQQWDGRQ